MAARIALNTLKPDPAQRGVALKLDELLDRLIATRSPRGFISSATNSVSECSLSIIAAVLPPGAEHASRTLSLGFKLSNLGTN